MILEFDLQVCTSTASTCSLSIIYDTVYEERSSQWNSRWRIVTRWVVSIDAMADLVDHSSFRSRIAKHSKIHLSTIDNMSIHSVPNRATFPFPIPVPASIPDPSPSPVSEYEKRVRVRVRWNHPLLRILSITFVLVLVVSYHIIHLIRYPTRSYRTLHTYKHKSLIIPYLT